MTDIYLAMVLIIAVTFAVYRGSRQLGSRLAPWQAHLLGLIVVVTTLLYTHFVWHSTQLTSLLPFSSLIVLGNWFLPLAAALTGLVWEHMPAGRLRRSLTLGALLASAGYSVLMPFLAEAPDCGDRWTAEGFCVQTTDESCSAACAASLLAHYGIATTEQEMADLCFSGGGTTWLGLYRGLKLKTQGTGLDVRVLNVPAAQLRNHATSPMILSVGLERGGQVSRGFELETGWTPGARHSVLMVSHRSSRYAEIVDPSPAIGRERWSEDELELLFRGPAIQLVPRSESLVAALR